MLAATNVFANLLSVSRQTAAQSVARHILQDRRSKDRVVTYVLHIVSITIQTANFQAFK